MRRPLAVLALLALTACGGTSDVAAPAATPTPTPSSTPAAVEGCPEAYAGGVEEPWVPAPPTTQTPGRLVPDADPVEVLVCRYGDVFDADSAALEGEVVLEGGLDRIRTDLLVPAAIDGAHRACTDMGGALVPHLVRMRYADGDLWLSSVQDPNRCTGSTNGAFVSSAYLGDLLAQAYDTGTWPSRDADPCASGGLGRAGQEQTLVPDGWTSLIVCEDGGSRRPVGAEQAAQAVDLLGQVTTQPSTGGCEGTPTSVSRLVAEYPAGPPVEVRFMPGCRPSVDNGSLSAALTPAQTELLTVLVG